VITSYRAEHSICYGAHHWAWRATAIDIIDGQMAYALLRAVTRVGAPARVPRPLRDPLGRPWIRVCSTPILGYPDTQRATGDSPRVAGVPSALDQLAKPTPRRSAGNTFARAVLQPGSSLPVQSRRERSHALAARREIFRPMAIKADQRGPGWGVGWGKMRARSNRDIPFRFRGRQEKCRRYHITPYLLGDS